MFFNRLWIDEAKTIKLSNDLIVLKPIRFYSDYYNGALIRNYTYSIFDKKRDILVGYCDLRLGDDIALTYLGNIGYNVFETYQRRGYASAATDLLIQLAKQLNVKKLNITCNTDNYPSIKTIEKCGFIKIADVAVPADEPLFQQGDYYKYIYTLDLTKE